jgi:phosphohistidine phosphatase
MELLLIRHAIARKRSPLRWKVDAERPLSPRGIRRFRSAAAGLERLVEPPELVLSSPLLRARQTASILRAVSGWPAARTLAVIAPGHGPDRILARLAQCTAARVAVVGHEPELGRLLASCLVKDAARVRVEFRKGAVACIAFEGAARPGAGTLRWLLPPRALRRLTG